MVRKQRRTVKKLHKRRNILKGYSKKKPHYIQKKSRRKKTSYKRKRSNKRTRGKRRKFILSGGVKRGREEAEEEEDQSSKKPKVAHNYFHGVNDFGEYEDDFDYSGMYPSDLTPAVVGANDGDSTLGNLWGKAREWWKPRVLPEVETAAARQRRLERQGEEDREQRRAEVAKAKAVAAARPFAWNTWKDQYDGVVEMGRGAGESSEEVWERSGFGKGH